MSENEIKPVAWMLECQNMGTGTNWKLSWTRSGAGVCSRIEGAAHEVSLYDQSTIDALTQQISELKTMLSIAEFQRKEMQAERDAAVADARRWNELCRQIDAGTFPSVVIEDAMEMGSGALELQVDASMAEGGE